MPESHYDISRAIGRLDATVENLVRTWGEQDRKATDGRKQLYERFDTLKITVMQMVSKVDQLTDDMSKIKPSVRLFEDGRQRSQERRSLGKVLWAIIVAAAASISWAISEWLHSGGPTPPHH